MGLSRDVSETVDGSTSRDRDRDRSRGYSDLGRDSPDSSDVKKRENSREPVDPQRELLRARAREIHSFPLDGCDR